MTDKAASGTILLEPETTQSETNPPAAGRGKARYVWLLLAVAALAGLAIWAAAQTSGDEQIAEETVRVASDHDGAIEQALRGGDIAPDGQPQHDAGIARLLRGQPVPPAPHDSGIAAALRERSNAGLDCLPLTPGAGGWEARAALGC